MMLPVIFHTNAPFKCIESFRDILDNCRLLSHLLKMSFGDPMLQTIWTMIILWSSLIRAHIVCFHGESVLEYI